MADPGRLKKGGRSARPPARLPDAQLAASLKHNFPFHILFSEVLSSIAASLLLCVSLSAVMQLVSYSTATAYFDLSSRLLSGQPVTQWTSSKSDVLSARVDFVCVCTWSPKDSSSKKRRPCWVCNVLLVPAPPPTTWPLGSPAPPPGDHRHSPKGPCLRWQTKSWQLKKNPSTTRARRWLLRTDIRPAATKSPPTSLSTTKALPLPVGRPLITTPSQWSCQSLTSNTLAAPAPLIAAAASATIKDLTPPPAVMNWICLAVRIAYYYMKIKWICVYLPI